MEGRVDCVVSKEEVWICEFCVIDRAFGWRLLFIGIGLNTWT